MTFLFIFGIHLSALLTPGPDFFLVSAYALKFSFKEALKAAFGVSLAILLWIIFSLTGLKILFDTFPFIQLVLSTLGAMYLFYLAYLLLKNISNEIHFTNSVKISQPFLGGFLTNITVYNRFPLLYNETVRACWLRYPIINNCIAVI